MHDQEHIGQELIDEIDRYLAAVEVFRAEGCEPTWRSELPVIAAATSASSSRARGPLRTDVGLH